MKLKRRPRPALAKTCGKCRYYRPYPNVIPKIGFCVWTKTARLPIAYVYARFGDVLENTNATNCPCFKRKEAK
jgi:hypothetical protein